MKNKLIAILAFPALCFGLISRQVGFARPRPTPRHFDTLTCGYNQQIAIIPALPTASDPISITASGTWRDACVPVYQSHQLMSDTIRIDAAVDYAYGTACALVITDWAFTISVGNLVTGSYQADLYIANPLITRTPVLCASKSFRVVDQVYGIYLPIVTKELRIALVSPGQ